MSDKSYMYTYPSDYYYYHYPQPSYTPKGWECPKCGRVFAPWITECQYCGKLGKTYIRFDTDTTTGGDE